MVFVYNRISHAEQCLSALNKNFLAPDTDLFLFSDAPNAAKKGDSEKVAEVRTLIQNFSENSRFASVHITEASEHQGLARSVISGVTKIVEQYGKVIVVEDDLICRHNFLNFMNDALNHYEKRKEVWSICGHTRNLKRLNQYPRDIYTTYRAGSWGWGTRKDRWDGIDWEVKDFPQLQNNKKLQRQFNRAGGDEYQMLVNQQSGVIDSWAIRWCYAEFKADGITIYPRQSFVSNIGFDGSGTNCSSTANEKAESLSPLSYQLTDDLSMDRALVREFCNAEYPPVQVRAVRKLKRMMHLSED